jgi:hypothetical protein
MMHDWTGDENSMYIFACMLPMHVAVLAPRWSYSAPGGGYFWRENRSRSLELPELDELYPSAAALIDLLKD